MFPILLLSGALFCNDKQAFLDKIQPAHNKTYSKTCVSSTDSDPLRMASVLVYPSLDSPKTLEGTCRSAKTLIRMCGCAG